MGYSEEVIERYAGLLTFDRIAPMDNKLESSLESISSKISGNHLEATISLFTYQENGGSENQEIRFSFFNQVGDNFPLFNGTGYSRLIDGEHLGKGSFGLYESTNIDIDASIRFIVTKKQKGLSLIGQWQDLKTTQIYLLQASLRFVEN